MFYEKKQKQKFYFRKRHQIAKTRRKKNVDCLPIGILSNESYQYVRDYIRMKREIENILHYRHIHFVQSGRRYNQNLCSLSAKIY